MEQLPILPTGPLHGRVRPPGSKSITNRVFACAALAQNHSHLTGVLESDDTRVMVECLRRLGAQIEWNSEDCSAVIRGTGGRLPEGDVSFYCQNSGTTIRFLTAICALGPGRYRLDGNARMRQRPIGDLIRGLRQLGIPCDSEFANDCPPIWVVGSGLAGGEATIAGETSSQFLSGLLLAAPYARTSVKLRVSGTLVSRPYVDMTIRVMRAFGAQVREGEPQRFEVEPGGYRGQHYEIEPDASGASYFWAAAAITGGEITVEGLQPNSLQGDVRFVHCLAQMGCDVQAVEGGLRVRGGALRGIDVDMSEISDTVPSLAVVALFANSPTRIRGIAHVRHKESDRIADLARELRKMGADVEELSDGLCISPQKLHGANLVTYDDHRLAMALSLVGLNIPGVVIQDPACVSKTYPQFFADLRRLCGR